MRRTRRPGYTLMEMMLVLGICLLALGAGILQIRPQSGGGQSPKALAMLVAGELRAARGDAMATGAPKGVAFPSEGATKPHTQSLYFLVGNGTLRETGMTDYASQCPGAYLYVGMWPLANGGYGLNPSSSSYFTVAGWLNPPVRDNVFVFTPDGHAHANDLAFNQALGQWCVVACAGLDYTGGAAPAGVPTMGTNEPGYFSLSEVDQPYTISITPAGGVFVTPGLPDAGSGVTITGGAHTPATPPAPLPLPSVGNHPPTIAEVDVQPQPNQANGAFSTTVNPNGYATLTVRAYDTDGADLSFSWMATGGNFTSGFPCSLSFDPSSTSYMASIQWFPPVGAVAGSSYTLTCTVTDPYGNNVSTSGVTSVSVGVTQLGRMVFGGTDHQVYIMNGDGTVPQNLSKNSAFNDTSPSLSPDGTKVAFVSNRVAEGVSTPSIWWMTSDSVSVNNVTGGLYANDASPSWSPDGTELAFVRTSGSSTKIEVCQVDGHQVGVDLDDAHSVSWSGTPPGTLVYEKAGAIWTMTLNPDGTVNTKTQITTSTTDSVPTWSPDSSRIVFMRGSDLYECKPDGTSQYLKNPSWSGSRISYRPNGSQFIGTQGGHLMRGDDPGLGQPLTNLIDLTPPGLATTPTGTGSWGP